MGDITLVLWGMGFGLAASAPLGPINFLCIRHTLRFGFSGGVLTGVGSALGDTVFAAAAALGTVAVAEFMAGHAVWMQPLAAIFLIAMGAYTLRQPVSDADLAGAGDGEAGNYLAVILTTLILTLTNPFTFTGFVSMIASISERLAAAPGYGAIVLLTGSVFLGSMLWWVFLSRLVMALRHRLKAQSIDRLNRFTGLAIIGFGLFVLARMLWTVTG